MSGVNKLSVLTVGLNNEMNGKPIREGLVSEEETYIATIADTAALPTVKFVPPL